MNWEYKLFRIATIIIFILGIAALVKGLLVGWC